MTEVSRSTDSATTDAPGLPSGEFVPLFTKAQRRLYLFILAQVPNPVEAEEILQETNLVIWRKSATFVPGTNFLAWAGQIARFEVLKYLEKRRRDKVRFSPEFIEKVSEEALADAPDLEERRKALINCLKKLRAKDRELIQMRYAPGENGIALAKGVGRPVNSVYQSLGRIRRTLLECINRQLAAEAGQ